MFKNNKKVKYHKHKQEIIKYKQKTQEKLRSYKINHKKQLTIFQMKISNPQSDNQIDHQNQEKLYLLQQKDVHFLTNNFEN